MVDYGTGYLLHPPANIVARSEFSDQPTDMAVVVLVDMVESPVVQWRNTDPICASCGLVVPEEKGQLDLFDD